MNTRCAAAISLLAGMAIGGGAIQVIHAQARPPVFLIFDAEVKDRANYQPFLETAVKEIQGQGGKFLVRGTRPEVLSGPPTPNIISISQWNSKESVLGWFNSEAMKPVRDAQEKYTVTRLLVVEGLAAP
jgi:uncharacterized protein (DUF1330 family)